MSGLREFIRVATGHYVRESERRLGESIGRTFALGGRVDIEWWPHCGWQFVVRFCGGPVSELPVGGIGSLHRIAMAVV